MECPRCGTVLRFSTHQLPSRNKSDATNCTWDPRTSRVQCHNCYLRCTIGLIAWPVRGGGSHKTAPTIPRDQVPHERQLAQLRAMEGAGAGWWMPREQAKEGYRPDDTNVTANCTCRPGTENTTAQDPSCPIHGGG